LNYIHPEKYIDTRVKRLKAKKIWELNKLGKSITGIISQSEKHSISKVMDNFGGIGTMKLVLIVLAVS
jgi:hypothetical protein